jgi:hypothetical protein
VHGRLPRLLASRGPVTKSLWLARDSSRGRNPSASIFGRMDAVAILIGVAMFLILLSIVEGIDRV